MKKAIQIILVTVCCVFGLLLALPLVLVGRIEPIIKTEANKMLNAKVEFDKLNISLLRNFPRASLALDGLSVVGVEEFEGDTLLSADRIAAAVNVMSLFGDEGFEVSKIELRTPRIYALKRTDGAVNWDIFKSTDTAEEEQESDTTESSFRLLLRDVALRDGRIAYIDDSSKMVLAADDINIALSGDMRAAQTAIDTRLQFGSLYFATDGNTLLNNVSLGLDARINADLDKMRFELQQNTLAINDIRLSLDGWVELPEQAIDMDLKLSTNRIDFKELLSLIPAIYTNSFDQLSASGALRLDGWAKGRIEGESYPSFALNAAIDNGSFKYASLPKSVDNIRLHAAVTNPGGSLDRTVIDVADMGLSIAGQSLSGKLHATNPLSDISFDAVVDGTLNLGGIGEVYPLPDSVALSGTVTANIAVAARMSDIEKERYESINARGDIAISGVDARLSGLPEVKISQAQASVSPKALSLGRFDATVGQSDIAASGNLHGYLGYLLRGDKLTGNLHVKSRLLNLNELMSPSDDVQEAEDDSTSMSAPRIPENLDLALTIDLRKILFQQMTLENLTGKATIRNQKLSMPKLTFEALGGKITASASYATPTAEPDVTASASIQNASFARTFNELEMIRKLVPLFEKTGGNYSMSLDLSTRMSESMDIQYPTLQASGEIRSENIQLQNMEVFGLLSTALKNDSFKNIQARNVRVAFTVKDGRLATKPFDLKLGSANLNLSGSTGLDQSIDYTAMVSLPEGTAGGYIKRIPVEIGGTFTKPTVRLGVEQMAGDALKQAIGSGLQQVMGSKAPAEMNKTAVSQTLLDEAKAAGDKLIETARKEGQKLIDKASSPLSKLAAEKSAELLIKTAEKQAAKLIDQAQAKIDAQK
ncbi:MAG: AsmA family protein [Rikenellaceae bacterium]|nr:AsmA family protein [Rikenellaceae bacterium]